MMTNEQFRENAHKVVDWMADYMEDLSKYDVKPKVKPGDIKKQLPLKAPLSGEDFEVLFNDFEKIILPGITHWQHPQFFAYFPVGASAPSILGEMLSATLGAQCMIWLTSPSAEELEERVMEWLRDAKGLPKTFTGVIQDSSSTANLVAMLSARENKSKFSINDSGFSGSERFRIYTSEEAHSSIEKGAKIIGIGRQNLIKIKTDENFAMLPGILEQSIKDDIANGFTPLCVVSTIGTTSSTAIDPIEDIGKICQKYDCWHHIDASYAGSALLIPEYNWMIRGIEFADSYVFNPHKWLFTNFDCSAYFVKDKNALVNTFSIMPEYLKTEEDKLVNNYRDWSIPLGRRFRALKLWFVLRSYGIEGLRQTLSKHIEYGQWVKEQVLSTDGFELMAPVPLNLVCFRIKPHGMENEDQLERINSQLLSRLNASGKILLNHTKLKGNYVLRFVAGQANASKDSVALGWNLIKDFAQEFL